MINKDDNDNRFTQVHKRLDRLTNKTQQREIKMMNKFMKSVVMNSEHERFKAMIIRIELEEELQAIMNNEHELFNSMIKAMLKQVNER
ncbi:hypothetical protein [Vreelandella titanicae]|nr:hypothetical protein [Halomonas titanicae]